MRHYHDLLELVLKTGVEKHDRRHRHAIGVRHQARYDLGARFPLLTTKKLFTKAIVLELLWFLRGDTNVRWLQGARGHDLGRMGGRGWRAGPGLRPSMAKLAI